MPFNDMFADGKAKAGAGLSPVPLDLIEALKYALKVLLGDAWAIVCYAKDDAVADLPGQRLYSDDRRHSLTLSDGQHTLLDLTADRYGRWDSGVSSSAGASLRIALIGRETDHRLVYPATLGSLGDAAASLGLNLDVHFFAPVSLSPGLHDLHDVQGVVLPGGSSMAAVKGQIRVAEETLARGQPTLGLCLGMQSMMTAAVRRSRAGLSDPNRPSGSFLFLGPTGVGKTELTKSLANFLFDDENAMVRIDMSEFMEKHSVSRLVGAPPGYVGYEEGGVLTEAVRRRPYSVVLFDEVEKAHPDVFNILLQVLDDGRLTDSQGRVVDFKNTVIIMTSNLGSHKIQEMAGDTYEDIKAAVMTSVNQHFRPEFINRIDEIVVFHPLGQAQMAGIAEIQLARLRKRLQERELNITLSDEAMSQLVAVGYDPVFGARPLKRAIQQEIENPLSVKLLAGDFVAGDTIKVDVDANDKLTFDKLRMS